MASGTISPSPWFTGFDDNGNPVSGGKLFIYTAGTTTKATTYSDVGLTTPNANPLILDAGGRGTLFMPPGASYKFVLSPATDTDPPTNAIKTQDNILSVPSSAANLDILGVAGEGLSAGQVVYLSDGSGSKTAGQWYLADSDFTYASSLAEIGMVPSSITALATGTIRLGGSVTGLTSLVVGTSYYVSSTAGAMTATIAGTAPRLLGVADTTSSLILTANPAYATMLSRAVRITATTPYFLTFPAADALGSLGSDGAGSLAFTVRRAPYFASTTPGTGIAAATTAFLCGRGRSATESSARDVMGQAGTMNNLYVQLDGDPGNTFTFIVTVRKNGVDTALTCTVTGNGSNVLTASDLTHSFTFVAGDLVSVKVVTLAGASTRECAVGATVTT